jgi:hypothetical protein
LVKEIKLGAFIGQKRVIRERKSKGLVISIFDIIWCIKNSTSKIIRKQKPFFSGEIVLLLSDVPVNLNRPVNFNDW